ncbi:DHA2 family efflux MFS transporter permease subunit [Priestia koreensis]|uniref:DHA2 family efflux MFS transporter permease subunit n=1 Tax=Priestia koreensis TaxID=284581 RepID=UPI001F570DB4|nr:DHA2 family efflux MFS transporter permease subunit [Priestia koreensis]MCM3002706.1 DHA2 family efflux MFS transporter permease subunit [Priestia koreensis]UNL84404.1 DHA2 family efflux MFS transporter permease subunit [Priestia koreensis]
MTSQAAETQDNGIRRHIPLLVILMLGLFLAILNQTLLNVAMPHLMNEFGVSATTIQWLSTGYMLVNGVLIPLSAFLIERFGTRILFLIAMFCFTIGTLVCGIAPNFSIMLIGRIIQAIGGGVLQPLVMTIIFSIFPPEMRGRGMGIFGLAMMFAPAVGPTLSGWVIQNYDWRLMFYALVPFGVIIFAIAAFKLKNVFPPKQVRLDVIGSLLSIVGVASLLYGVSQAGSDGWGDPVVLLTIIIGLIGIVAFILQQLRSERPLLDFRVFNHGIFSLANVINAVITVAMFTGMFLLPIFLQNLRGFTPLQSGLLLLPGALIMLAMSPISGVLFDKVGPRPLAIVGMIITTITTFEFTRLTIDTSYSWILGVYIARSFGMSLLMMPVMTAGMNQLPKHLTSHGTAMTNTLRQVMGSLGISLVTTVYTNRTVFHSVNMSNEMNTANPQFMHSFQSYVQSVAQSMHIPVEQAKTYAMQLLGGKMQIDANVMGINDAFYWSSILCVVGTFLSLFLRDVRKDKAKQKREELPMLPSPKEAKSS